MVKWKVEPLCNSLSNQIFPPCISTRFRVMFKPRPGARQIADHAVLGAKEFLEDAFLLLRRNSQAGILDKDVNHLRRAAGIPLVGGALGRDPKRAAREGVFLGVADEIGEDLDQPAAIHPYRRQVGGNLERQFLLLGFDLRPEAVDHFLQCRPQRHGGELQLQPPGFDPGDVVQVGDQRGHAVGVEPDGGQEVGLRLGDRTDRALRQEVRIAADRRHRRLEFVGDKRDEFALGLVGVPHLAVKLRVGNRDRRVGRQPLQEFNLGG